MIQILPYGENALLVNFNQEISYDVHLKTLALYEELRTKAMNGIISLIPAYASLTVIFNPEVANFNAVKTLVNQVWKTTAITPPISKNIVRIPVCYEKEYAIDLDVVCQHTGLSSEEVVHRHTTSEYLVYMLGFTPGFLYLGGMDKKLHTPRKETPRTKINKGAVGIAGDQTGIYPLESPGGWQIIGCTPCELLPFRSTILIEAGDYVKFYPVSKKEFKSGLLNITKETFSK